MSRQPRFVLPGQPQHVIQRGNNRDIIFVSDDDYQFYLEKLDAACARFNCELHAYVLMTNHVHLLITPQTEDGISKLMQSVGRYYVQYFNYRYKRTGTLWEGRYKATLLDSETYLLICSRYIELNPVRAGMVADPADYPWSSYGCNALGIANTLIKSHELYLALGLSADKRCEVYKDLFPSHIDSGELDEIRESTNKSWALGSSKFKERIEKLTARQAQPKGRGGDRKSKKYQESIINRV
ncbi:MAG: transposase [Zetaproteobacteria bacterium CG2_30_46_52]|nr:MAG: transposase [Zetaproteobacteria bacterium CG2_30_46_52]